MYADFLKLLESLTNTGLEFVIVGGVAARLYGNPRLTHDIDIVPRFEAESWAHAIDALWDAGARPRIPEPRERVRDVNQVARWISEKGMLALSFRSLEGLVEIDFLVGEADRFAELRQRATRVEIDRNVFWVAHIDDLIELKLKAGRPQDLLDVDALRQIKKRTERAE
jgi:predicted nucleotidyltransferase